MAEPMRFERQGAVAEPITRRLPDIRGGICEFCGVLDPWVDSKDQYKLCPHFRGQQLRCSYCPANKNADEVVYRSRMKVAEHPDKPGTWIAWCDSYECEKAHNERFKINPR